MLSIRKIGVLGRTYRHLNRYRQILGILFSYGFGEIIELLKIDQYLDIGLQMISKNRGDRIEKLSRAERIRMAIEELGPTYIKLGQVLSTRPDLIPAEFITELIRLQDDVPPFSFDETEKIILSEFGVPFDALFEFLEKTPVASASIAQVYRAGSRDGEILAVKIQRPGIKRIIEVDLEIMLHLATLMERHIEEFALHRPVRIVEEFTKVLENEIDFTIEAASMERIAAMFLNDPAVYIPKVFRDKSSSAVLTMEMVEGIKITHVEAIEKAGLDRRLLTVRGADVCLKQIFQYGFFHADPHPGNIYALPGNVICLLDFGMVGTVDQRTREDIVELVDSIVHHHPSRAVQVLLRITEWDREPNLREFEKDVSEFMGQHLYKPLRDIKIGRLLQHLLEISSAHGLRIPADIFLMLKALGTVEGIALVLDPEFDMVSHAAPYIRKVKLARLHPDRIAGDVLQLASQLMGFMGQFPQDILEISRLIRQQKLTVKIEQVGLSTLLATQDQISNRIAFSIVIAALIIGSALIVISKTPPLVYGISFIGFIGFIAAALMGIWLLVAIIRKGKL
jgi:ubiquinone biosynthesis protein